MANELKKARRTCDKSRNLCQYGISQLFESGHVNRRNEMYLCADSQGYIRGDAHQVHIMKQKVLINDVHIMQFHISPQALSVNATA